MASANIFLRSPADNDEILKECLQMETLILFNLTVSEDGCQEAVDLVKRVAAFQVLILGRPGGKFSYLVIRENAICK